MTNQPLNPKVESFNLGDCKHRGLPSDRELRLAFPSESTFCYKNDPPFRVDTQHQIDFCLCDKHVECPVFKGEIGRKVPVEIRAAPRIRPHAVQARGYLPMIAAIGVLAAAIIGLIIYLTVVQPQTNTAGPTLTETISPTSGQDLVAVVDEETPTITPTPTEQPTETAAPPTETLQPTETIWPTITLVNSNVVDGTATPTPKSADTTTVTPATPKPEIFEVDLDIVGSVIRAGPDIEYGQLGVVDEANTAFDIIGTNETQGWLQICCIDDELGWISAELVPTNIDISALAVIDPPTMLGLVIVAQANMRTGPSPNFGIIEALQRDDTIEVTGRNPRGDWFEVCCVGEEVGWVFGELVRINGPYDAIPIIDPTEE